ncbi:MAG: acetyl-CoA carboxylase biotin carboxyl carrier protein subunit [Pseudomonadota bacterium]
MPVEVCAYITGMVWKLTKQPGDKVTQGEVVAILESMKMEMPVGAPVSGIVTAVNVKEGDAVAEGAVLVVIG